MDMSDGVGMNVGTWLRRACAVLVLMTGAAQAQDSAERPAQLERLHVMYRINADGSYVEEREQAVKVLASQALEDVKETSASYSTSIQTLEVLKAYTLKPDGRKVDAPRSNFQTTSNGGHGDGAPVFSDRSTLTAVFPELAVGDTAVFAYRLTGSKPMFDGHFSTIESLHRDQYVGELTLRFDAPAALPVKFESWQMEKVSDATRNGRRVIEWRYRNTSPGKTKGSPLYDVTRHPGVAFSTFQSYGDIAQAYGARATPKAAVTPRIRTLADEIVPASGDRRETARALYEWVSRNITYAGNCIGLGAVVPHDLDFVLDNRMGDCKDHATLLQALLAAKGIQSTQALINSSDVFVLPGTPVASTVNHVINYLPEWNLYLDATAKDIPFGMLPIADAGKRVLHVDGYRDDTRTPAVAVGSNRSRADTRLRIAADGSLEGETRVELQGMYAVYVRAGFRQGTREQISEAVDARFKAMGKDGSASIEMDDPAPMTDRFAYTLRFKAGQVMPVPGAIPLQPMGMDGLSIARFAAQADAEIADEGETACGSGHAEEHYRYEFAPALNVVAVPPDATVKGDTLDYRATYRLEGNALEVVRILDDRTPGPTCTPQYDAQFREWMQQIQKNLKAQVVFQ